MSATNWKDLQLHAALWALRRIVRKQAGFTHTNYRVLADGMPEQTCDCPQCIAKDALDRIAEAAKTT